MLDPAQAFRQLRDVGEGQALAQPPREFLAFPTVQKGIGSRKAPQRALPLEAASGQVVRTGKQPWEELLRWKQGRQLGGRRAPAPAEPSLSPHETLNQNLSAEPCPNPAPTEAVA